MPDAPVVPFGEDEDPQDARLQDLPFEGSAKRAEAAVALRLAGATYPEIANTCGYTDAFHARQAVERVLAASVGEDGRDQLRAVEGKRLERLLRSTWKRATDPGDTEHLAYVRAALALIDRHVRLFGLDAPQQMVVYSPAQGEIEAWVAGMARTVVADLPTEADIIGSVIYEPEETEADTLERDEDGFAYLPEEPDAEREATG